MLKNLKKYLFAALLIVSFFGIQCFAAQPSSNKFPYENNPYLNSDKTVSSTDLGNDVYIDGNDSIINRLLGVFGLSNIEGDHKFITYVRGILNIALGLLSMIALIMTIYTFYMMFFTENEAGAKKAKGNLIGIFIALGIIGLSWLIVSFIFRWYQSNWQGALNLGGN